MSSDTDVLTSGSVTALAGEPSMASGRAGMRWTRPEATTIAAVVVGMIPLISVSVAMSTSTWYQDDWPALYSAAQGGLDVDVLLQRNNGYLAPGAVLMQWATQSVEPFSRLVPGVANVLCLGAFLLTAWLVLRAWVPRPRLRLVLFSAVALSPLWIVAAAWWNVGTGILPALAISSLSLLALKRTASLPAPLAVVLVVLPQAVALAFTPKSLLTLAFVAGLALVVAGRAEGRWRRLRTRELVMVVALGSIAAAYLMVYLAEPSRQVPFTQSVSRLASIIENSLLGTFVPGLVGGPWATAEGPYPYFALIPTAVAAGLLFVLLGGVAAARIARGADLWLGLPAVLMVAANVGLLSWAAIGVFGADITRQGRYWTDLLLPVALSVGIVLSSGASREPLIRGRAAIRLTPGGKRLGTSLVVIGLVVSSVGGHLAVLAAMERSSAKSWLANATSSLAANPEANVFNRESPQTLVSGALFPAYAMQSGLLAHWVTDQRFDEPGESFQIFDELGALRPAQLLAAGATFDGPSAGCGYLVDRQPVPLAVSVPAYPWKWMLQVNYLAGSDGELELDFGDESVVVPVQRGLGQAVAVRIGAIDKISARAVTRGLSVCVDRVQWGNPGVAAP